MPNRVISIRSGVVTTWLLHTQARARYLDFRWKSTNVMVSVSFLFRGWYRAVIVAIKGCYSLRACFYDLVISMEQKFFRPSVFFTSDLYHVDDTRWQSVRLRCYIYFLRLTVLNHSLFQPILGHSATNKRTWGKTIARQASQKQVKT